MKARPLLIGIVLAAAAFALGAVAERQGWLAAATDGGASRNRDGREGHPPGRWGNVRRPGGVSTTDDALSALPYLSGKNEAGEDALVVRHDAERASPGYNLYVSGHAPEAHLMDMQGRYLHRWTVDPDALWKGLPSDVTHRRYMRRAHVFENGDLLAVFRDMGAVRVDKDSRVLWSVRTGAHHDFDLDPDGNVHVLTHVEHVVPRMNPDEPVMEDFVTVIGADGKEGETFSLFECFERSRYAPLIEPYRGLRSMFHSNAIQWLDGTHAERSAIFARGNLLISFRTLDAIAIVDPGEKTVVWALAGAWRRQHEPVLLPSGRMLLFDNATERTGSRVIEFDPLTQEVVWEYRGTPSAPFFSGSCGTCSRLPNGNTLITESDFGRAFEVTPGGDIVWEFVSPHRAGDESELVATLFNVVRLPPDFPVAAFATRPDGE